MINRAQANIHCVYQHDFYSWILKQCLYSLKLMSSCLDSKGGSRRPSTLQFHFISIYNGFDVIFAYTSPRDIISSIFNVHVVRTCFERAKLIRCVCAILQIRNALIMMFNLSQGFLTKDDHKGRLSMCLPIYSKNIAMH